MNNITPSCLIQKEDISRVKFSKLDTISNPKKRALRHHYLQRASQLGNLLKTKVKIHFKDDLNKSMIVDTTIWAVTSKFVVLKQGITIPISSIVYVE